MIRKKYNILVLAILFLALFGSLISPMTTSAAQTQGATQLVEAKVIYKEYNGAEMKTKYWGKEAPKLDGYYFGGWYATSSDSAAIKYTSHMEAIGDNDTVYAKFVPSYMLNVKVQNNKNLCDTSIVKPGTWATAEGVPDRGNIRMISAVDSIRYKEVGLPVYVANRKGSKQTN